MNFTEYEIETNTQPYLEDICPVVKYLECINHGILLGAKKIIEKNGWCRKSLKKQKHPSDKIRSWQENPVVGYCVLGAIEESAKQQLEIEFVRSHEAVLESINIFEKSNSINSTLTISSWNSTKIPQWNDKWYRSKRSVLKAFDKSIISRTWGYYK